MNDFDLILAEQGIETLRPLSVRSVQVNVGLKCNQACTHCHLSASPSRNEMMGRETMDKVVEVIRAVKPVLVDITGGAPELNPDLRWFISTLSEEHIQVQVRTNLTALLDDGSYNIAEFYRDHGVNLVASMPCYLEENVRAQRGGGVYERSIEALRMLNRLGYGTGGELELTLVYNPGGPGLPPNQQALEADYKRELEERHDVNFTRLFVIANMPIGRFGESLAKQGKKKEYIAMLKASFNPSCLGGLMCRHQISVDWNGRLYDCDFNIALSLPIEEKIEAGKDNFDARRLLERTIVTGMHCFGCTAGAGSSCGGSLA